MKKGAFSARVFLLMREWIKLNAEEQIVCPAGGMIFCQGLQAVWRQDVIALGTARNVAIFPSK
jgi:hypothetical protein